MPKKSPAKWPPPPQYQCLTCGWSSQFVSAIQRHIDEEHGGATWESDVTREDERPQDAA